MELQMKDYDLPLESACCHEDWKVRMLGYQRTFEIFVDIEDKNSSQWNSFIEIIKQFVFDENPSCHKKGLLVVLTFVNKCGQASKTTKEVVAAIINNCLDSDQGCIIALAIDIIFNYIKIGQHEIVNRELTDTITKSSNSKKVSTCLFIIGEAIKLFGISVAELKHLIRLTTPLTQVENKEVRREAENLFQLLMIWATPDIVETMATTLTQQLTVVKESNDKIRTLGDVCNHSQRINTDNESELTYFNKNSTDQFMTYETSEPLHIIGYQDIRSTEICNRDIFRDGNVLDSVETENSTFIIRDSNVNTENFSQNYTKLCKSLDSYIENPLNLLEKFKKEFYIEEQNFQKWIELDQLVQNILYELTGKINCSQWIDTLLSLLNKNFPLDICCTNIKCITFCAITLKTTFEPYIPLSMHILFRKFEEKQPDLTNYVRECIDSIFECTNLEKLQSTLCPIFTNSRNHLVKLEINSFLVRCFLKSKNDLQKGYMKTYFNCLTMDLNDQHLNIRNSAVEALGIAMKLIDKQSLEPHLIHVKDFMLKKIKKYAENIEISISDGINMLTNDEESSSYSNKKQDELESQSSLTCNFSNESQNINNECKKAFVNGTYLGETEDEYIDSSDLEFDSDYEITSSEEYPDDDSLRSRYWDDNLDVASELALEEETNATMCDGKYIDEMNANEHNCSFYNDFSDYDSDRYIEEIYRKSNYNDDPITHDEKNLGKYSDQITFDNAEELFDRKDVLDKTVTGITLKHTSRIAINEVRDQLLRNLCRKYRFEPGRIPLDFKYTEKLNSQNKTQLFMSDNLLGGLNDKDLHVRRQSLEEIQSIVNCTVNPIDSSSPSLRKASATIAERISDCSLETSLSAVNLIESLISSMGPSSEQYIETFFPPLLRAMGDPRPGIRQAALSCIKQWEEVCSMEKFFGLRTINAVERQCSLAQRQELWKWVALSLVQIPLQSVSEKELITCLGSFYQYISDTDYRLDESSLASFLGFMRHLHSKDLLKACKKNDKLRKIITTLIENKRSIFPREIEFCCKGQ